MIIEKLLKPIKENKRFFILLFMVFMIFFLGLDFAGGLVKNYSGHYPFFFFPFVTSFGYIEIEGNLAIHILPFINLNCPYFNLVPEDLIGASPSCHLIFPRYMGGGEINEMDYHSLLFELIYLINTILVSLIISYLITLIYEKIKRKS